MAIVLTGVKHTFGRARKHAGFKAKCRGFAGENLFPDLTLVGRAKYALPGNGPPAAVWHLEQVVDPGGVHARMTGRKRIALVARAVDTEMSACQETVAQVVQIAELLFCEDLRAYAEPAFAPVR